MNVVDEEEIEACDEILKLRKVWDLWKRFSIIQAYNLFCSYTKPDGKFNRNVLIMYTRNAHWDSFAIPLHNRRVTKAN